MRAFIAIDLPLDIKDFISKIQDKLKSTLPKVSWVKPLNLHLTLKFLGEISAKQLDDINQIIEAIASKANCFKIECESLGVFPNLSRARIIWIGTEKIMPELKQIVDALETKLSELGFAKEERLFRAHITIGRIKFHITPSILENTTGQLKNEIISEKLEFTCGRITLFESALGPGGPNYTVLKEAILKIT